MSSTTMPLFLFDRGEARPSRVSLWLLCAAGLLLYVAAASLNSGIVAMDDYYDGMARFIPAQAHSAHEIIANAGYRSPLPVLLPYGIARVAQGLGITVPSAQLHFVLSTLSLVGFLVLFSSAVAHFPGYTAEGERNKRAAGFLLGFYFLCPFFLSRAMIEALSAPWLLASSAFACAYWNRPARRFLFASMLCLGAASLMRFQSGVCVIALVLTVAFRRRWRDLTFAFVLLVVGFVLTGLLDLALRGKFHGSLRAYVSYNLDYATATCGSMAWYVFPALFVALALPPFLISRYRGFRPVMNYAPIFPAILYFIVFVGAHTCIPHKEERFMIPVMPIFLVLLAPLAAYFSHKARAGSASARFRVGLFLALDGVLLPLVTLFPAQKTTLDLAAFVEANPRIASVLVDEPLIFPHALVERPISKREVAQMGRPDCSTVAAVFSPGDVPKALLRARFRPVARFEPGPLERLIYRMNPKRNARRRPLEVYAPPGCSYTTR